jgi:prophage tail gpP-like protein
VSGLLSVFSGAPGVPVGADPDEVSIQVGNRHITGWQTVGITRSVEAIPNSFQVTCADQFPEDPARVVFYPGQAGEELTLRIGPDLVITGYADRYAIQVGPRQHEVIISGRGKTQDLVDCSADVLKSEDLKGASLSAPNLRTLAQRLCKPFGLTARSAVEDLGKPIPTFTVAIGETSYEILERIARYAGYLIYEDETGNLVLDRVGTAKMASGFTMPGNIESATSTLAIDGRFSDYAAVWQSVNAYVEINPVSNQKAAAHDPTMPRYRPRIIVSEQTDNDQTLAQRRMDWEMNRRIGRSQSINLTCDSWRDTAGRLWTPNRLAKISAAALKLVDQEWIIGNVTFRKDQSGTHADLILMPPNAYAVEPAPLYLWNRELEQMPPTSQTPNPAGTSSPTQTAPAPASTGLATQPAPFSH